MIWIIYIIIWSSSVHSLSCVQLFSTPWTAALQASPSLTISRSWAKFTSIELVTPTSHLIFCCPLLLFSISPSIRVFFPKSQQPPSIPYSLAAMFFLAPLYWKFFKNICQHLQSSLHFPPFSLGPMLSPPLHQNSPCQGHRFYRHCQTQWLLLSPHLSGSVSCIEHGGSPGL